MAYKFVDRVHSFRMYLQNELRSTLVHPNKFTKRSIQFSSNNPSKLTGLLEVVTPNKKYMIAL